MEERRSPFLTKKKKNQPRILINSVTKHKINWSEAKLRPVERATWQELGVQNAGRTREVRSERAEAGRYSLHGTPGLPWRLRRQKIHPQCKRPRFDPRVGKILWRGKRQLTPVFLPGGFHGQRSLTGYSPRGHRDSDATE